MRYEAFSDMPVSTYKWVMNVAGYFSDEEEIFLDNVTLEEANEMIELAERGVDVSFDPPRK